MVFSDFCVICVELCSNTYKTHLTPSHLQQKKVIQLIHEDGYREQTNALFKKSRLLKFESDLVKQPTLLGMLKVKTERCQRVCKKCLFSPQKMKIIVGNMILVSSCPNFFKAGMYFILG